MRRYFITVPELMFVRGQTEDQANLKIFEIGVKLFEKTLKTDTQLILPGSPARLPVYFGTILRQGKYVYILHF